MRFIRPSIVIDRQEDLHGHTLFQQGSIGAVFLGARNLQAQVLVRPGEKVLVGGKTLQQTYGTWLVQIDPSRRFTRVLLQVRQGQSIDFANARTGNGVSAQFTAIVRPIDRTTFELDASREWLNAGGGRLYTANVERLRSLYSFTSNSIVRLILQYDDVNRNPSRYTFAVPQHSGTFLGSLLYSYKLNWQTVLFVGYGDDRVLTPTNDLVRADRSVFFKVSYALQM